LFNDQSAQAPNVFSGPVDIATFGRDQYQWHPAETVFMAHAEHFADPAVVAISKGKADPDGPIKHSRQTAGKDVLYDLPAASVVVIRGRLGLQ
jgi:hypothetical protein